jgi:hypothetical protein
LVAFHSSVPSLRTFNIAQLASTSALKVTGDDAAACNRVLDLFDKFDPETNTLVSPGHVGRL